MENVHLQAAPKGDKNAFLDAFARSDDIARRFGNVLTAIDSELNALIESPAGSPLKDSFLQLLGLAQIGFDYRDELARCHEAMWANQPTGLFDA